MAVGLKALTRTFLSAPAVANRYCLFVIAAAEVEDGTLEALTSPASAVPPDCEVDRSACKLEGPGVRDGEGPCLRLMFGVPDPCEASPVEFDGVTCVWCG